MKANAAYYDLTQNIDKVYESYHYTFIPDSTIPSGYQISDEALNYVIEQGSKALNSFNTQSHGVLVNWALNTVAQGIFSLYRNAFVAFTTGVAAIIDSNQCVYSWNVSLLEIDPNYTYHETYGPAYAFQFKGYCNEKMTLILDQNGDIYGTNPIGNYTYSQEVGVLTNQYIPEQYDPNEITVPTYYISNFSDLRPPYISGKELHFFYYVNDVEHEVVVDDFRDTTIFFDQVYVTGNYKRVAIMFANANGIQPNIYVDGSPDGEKGSYTIRVHNQNYNGTIYSFSRLYIPSSSGLPANSIFGFNLPGYYDSSWIGNGINNYNELGWNNSVPVSGSSNLYLKSYSTTPTETPANPNPAPINVPIPVTQIPEDPEDPIPQNPTPDPVPGEPVNPLPPVFRPLPSIVSGNDDLWPSVVELENIEIDLGGYISGLDDYEFPDLSSITSSFSGAIVWVSTIMSTLFNGSDFSILFAVLSSFFIVAALLGLYKWWNHK